mmetsp:Transcript_47100/g.98248  ORF Transcript_47100/g.98248 Transcript_47100/m.98248 type:complete len:87 (+) Transcript_47100:256-516(+)
MLLGVAPVEPRRLPKDIQEDSSPPLQSCRVTRHGLFGSSDPRWGRSFSHGCQVPEPPWADELQTSVLYMLSSTRVVILANDTFGKW